VAASSKHCILEGDAVHRAQTQSTVVGIGYSLSDDHITEFNAAAFRFQQPDALVRALVGHVCCVDVEWSERLAVDEAEKTRGRGARNAESQ
jgi:hypothetical protein